MPISNLQRLYYETINIPFWLKVYFIEGNFWLWISCFSGEKNLCISLKSNYIYTLKPWYNEPRYSEFCDIVNKPYFHFEDLLSNIKVWMYIKTSPTYNMSTITKSNCMHFYNFKSMICGHILNKMSYISSNIFKDIFPT